MPDSTIEQKQQLSLPLLCVKHQKKIASDNSTKERRQLKFIFTALFELQKLEFDHSVNINLRGTVFFTCSYWPIKENVNVYMSCRQVKLQSGAKVQLPAEKLKRFYPPLLYPHSLWGPARTTVLSWRKPRKRTKLSLTFIQRNVREYADFNSETRHITNRASFGQLFTYSCT